MAKSTSKTSHPWRNVVEDDPVVVGNPEGDKVFRVALTTGERSGKVRQVLPRLIRARSKSEALEIYRGDGIIESGGNMLIADVTTTYKLEPQPEAEVKRESAAGAFVV